MRVTKVILYKGSQIWNTYMDTYRVSDLAKRCISNINKPNHYAILNNISININK